MKRHVPILVVLGVTALVYGQVVGFAFVDFDDGVYVVNNHRVQSGFTPENLMWAFTTGETGTWQPLTLLSHMLDCRIYGLNAGGHHATNLILHLLCTLLLYMSFLKMTGDRWPSVFVAAVFALHPLHVESVAWVSERKDVLSTAFWFLTMYAYARYVPRRRWPWYVVATLSFALGLMVKPMLVTLPCVLLLLDFWPLRRLGTADYPWRISAVLGLFIEKVPWFALSAASCFITIRTQIDTQSVVSLSNLPLGLRVANALISYVAYLGKAIWPSHLAFFYPYPSEGIPPLETAGAVFVLALLTALAIAMWRRAAYVPVGWLWYLGTMVPVIGFVHVGAQSMADRYMYVPMVGLSLIPAWGVPALLRRLARHAGLRLRTCLRAGILCAAVVLCAAWAWQTHVQGGYWKDSLSLFRHGATVTEDNYLANANTGMALNEKEEFAEAVPYLQEAVRILPNDSFALFHLGLAYQHLDNIDSAIDCYRRAAEANPQNVEAHINLGVCLLRKGQPAAAADALSAALRLRPDHEETEAVYGIALLQTGEVQSALDHLLRAKRRHPRSASIRVNLGAVYAAAQRTDDAIAEFRAALQIDPSNEMARKNLENLQQAVSTAEP